MQHLLYHHYNILSCVEVIVVVWIMSNTLFNNLKAFQTLLKRDILTFSSMLGQYAFPNGQQVFFRPLISVTC